MSITNLASMLLERFEKSSIQLFLTLVCKVVEECDGNASGTEFWVTFMKSRHKKGELILTMKALVFKKEIIKKSVKYARKFHKLFSTNYFGTSSENENNFIIVFGGEEKGDGLGAARFLLMFKMRVRRSNKGQENLVLKCMKVKSWIYEMDETLVFFF